MVEKILSIQNKLKKRRKYILKILKIYTFAGSDKSDLEI